MQSLVWLLLLLPLVPALPNEPSLERRYVQLGQDGPFQSRQVDASALRKKRYVQIGSSKAFPTHKVDSNSLKKKSSLFEASSVTHKLIRSPGKSAELVKRGLLHPLLYYTQHYNRALSRRATMSHNGDLQKRDSLRRSHAKEAEERMRRRWADLYQERGLPVPQLELSKKKRGVLVPVEGNAKRSSIYGLNGKLSQIQAQSLRSADKKKANTSNNSTATGNASSGEGFSETKLEAALSGNVKEPDGKITTDDTEGLAIEANDVGYFGNLLLGTPGTNYKILFDTGSADFWVPSQQCNSDGTCGGHTTLGTQNSKTFVASNQGYQVTYGTGAVQGVLAQDTVALSDGSLSLPNHTFGVNTDETDDFAAPDVAFDGLMGMALSTLSNQKVPTYIESLATNGVLKNAQMGYNLASVDDPVQDSACTFGGIDSSKVGSGGLIEFKNVDKNGFWTGAMQSVSINGKALNINGKTGILDTGTSLMIAPQADAEAFHAAIPGSASDGKGGFTVPCTTSAQIEFEFGGTQFQMNPTDLAFVPVNQNDLSGDCVSALSAGDIDNQGSWLLGDAFLKSVYYATDVTTNTIGLSQKSFSTTSSGKSTASAKKQSAKAKTRSVNGHRKAGTRRL